MSKARLVITAVTVENRSVKEVVADYGVSRSWVYELLGRYREEGEAAFEPRSKRPKSSPRATPEATVGLVLRLRRQLTEQDLDAGADTIGWRLRHHHALSVSRAAINRILYRHGTITPDPSKRPRSSYIRFQAEMPNECWQSDFTHYRLADGAEVEIITWLDDHSRYALHVSAMPGSPRRSCSPPSPMLQPSTGIPRRLHSSIGQILPAEHEQAYYAALNREPHPV